MENIKSLKAVKQITPSNLRQLGLFISGLLTIIIGKKLIATHELNFILLSALAITLLCTAAYPQIFKPLHKLLVKMGLVLEKIVSPLIFFIIFTLIFTPISIFLKIKRKDPLGLKFSSTEDSYWVKRDQITDHSSYFNRQF